MKIAFDVGGVLSKYPHVLRPWIKRMVYEEIAQVYVISDMHPKEKIVSMLKLNDFGFIHESYIYSADYKTHGEKCKAVLCEELKIDILIDDHMGYLVDGQHIRLAVMPNTNEPYYHDSWKTDGTEGDFGRRAVSGEAAAAWTKDLVSFKLSVDPQRIRYERPIADYVVFPVVCNLTLKFKNMEYQLVAQNVSHDDFASISNTKCETLHGIAKWENNCDASESMYLRGTLMILGNKFIVTGMTGEQVANGDK